MRPMKKLLVLVVALGAMVATGCSGGGGGSSTPTSMKEVTPPANAGLKDGFVYASTQQVAVDIALPSATYIDTNGTVFNYIVTVYDKAPTPQAPLYATNPPAPVVSTPVKLAQGTVSSSTNHYTTTITVPTAQTSVYVVPMMGFVPSTAVVPITTNPTTNAKEVTYTFTQGGV